MSVTVTLWSRANIRLANMSTTVETSPAATTGSNVRAESLAAPIEATGPSAELSNLMTAMANRDTAALFRFEQQFGTELRSTVRSILGSLGRRDAVRHPADLEFLTLSAGLVIYDRASSWSCEGAAPWVWAKRAIRAEIVRWLGHPRVEFIPEFHARKPTNMEVAFSDISYRDLATQSPEIAAWIEAAERVTSDRNANVHIEYQTQKALGDPSPANTVSSQFGLKPANVRQIDRRVRAQLAERYRTTANPVLIAMTQ